MALKKKAKKEEVTNTKEVVKSEVLERALYYVTLKYGLDNLTKQQLKEMLIFANAAASIITTRKGALRVMPSLEEIQRLL